jgi:hypothetical protein
MSWPTASDWPLPAATVRVARAACPKGCWGLRVREEWGGHADAQAGAALFATRGQPAETPNLRPPGATPSATTAAVDLRATLCSCHHCLYGDITPSAPFHVRKHGLLRASAPGQYPGGSPHMTSAPWLNLHDPA